MVKSNSGRKQEILEAALQEFIKEGIAGARMKEIAQHIGVTKAMIHYYYQTKQNLFEEVFREACERLMNGTMEVLEKKKPLFLKIEQFIDQLIDQFHRQPELAGFITSELNQHAEITQPIFQNICSYDDEVFRNQLEEAASGYEVVRIEHTQIIANIISLCMFPYSSRGLLKTLLDINNTEYKGPFLEKRRELIKDTIINGLAG